MQCLMQFPRYHMETKKNCLFSLQTETRICDLSQWPIAQMSLLLFNTKSDFKSQIGRICSVILCKRIVKTLKSSENES